MDLHYSQSSLSLIATFFSLNVNIFPKNDAGEVEFGLGYICWNIGKLSCCFHSLKLMINSQWSGPS
jgi:hypothetical protein